jgi:hypothetical protein
MAVAPFIPLKTRADLTARQLIEYSINLDEALAKRRKT